MSKQKQYWLLKHSLNKARMWDCWKNPGRYDGSSKNLRKFESHYMQELFKEGTFYVNKYMFSLAELECASRISVNLSAFRHKYLLLRNNLIPTLKAKDYFILEAKYLLFRNCQSIYSAIVNALMQSKYSFN